MKEGTIPKVKQSKEELKAKRRARIQRKREESGYVPKLKLTKEELKANRNRSQRNTRRKKRLKLKTLKESGDSLQTLIVKAKARAKTSAAALSYANERMDRAQRELDRLLSLLPVKEKPNTSVDKFAPELLDDAVFKLTGFRIPKGWGHNASSSQAKQGLDWLAENLKPKPDTLA